MQEQLKQQNQKLIKEYKERGNELELSKQIAISHILEEPNAFKKMPIELAYSILADLGYSEEDFEKIYIMLTY